MITSTSVENHESRMSLRPAIVGVSLALLLAVGLGFYKRDEMSSFASITSENLKANHATMSNLFEASFYFSYEDQFISGLYQFLKKNPTLKRVEVLSNQGQVLFDSDHPASGAQNTKLNAFRDPEVIARLNTAEVWQAIRGFGVEALVPGQQFGIYYTFDSMNTRIKVLGSFLIGIFSLVILFWFSRQWSKIRLIRAGYRFWGLRNKFLVTIVLINILTGAIVFFSLSALQTKQETERIQKESIVFAQFSTSQVISDFTSYFYFYFADKFLPGINTIIATNQNLVAIRIISTRTEAILFDSELGAPPSDAKKAMIPFEMKAELKSRDMATRTYLRGGENYLSVINTYRNENREPLFYIEFQFAFESLKRNIAAIRRQIVFDLFPAMGLGLLIAVIFSQLLISPIRRIVSALRRVAAGDYEVSVENPRRDEIGELVTTFNSMTFELRKKKELRKYLSDSTYRKIMAAPDTPGGPRIGGTRLQATVLFSDIRNFVSHCESMEAEEVTGLLNEYFTEMVDIVYRHGGEVDKFIGDAILAVFYTTETRSAAGTALQSVYCALEMREKLKEMNQKRAAQGKNTIEIGVGITHGEIISGPIGSKDRMDFTVIGDVVNLANRIEKLSKKGAHTKIVFSQHVEAMVRGLLEYELLSQEVIRGKEETVNVFELIQIRDLETLIKSAKTGDPELKLRSVELLGQSRNRLAIPIVIEFMSHADEALRARAVVSLSKLAPIDDPLSTDALVQRLRIETSPKVLSALISALGKICRGDKILEVGKFLNSEDDRIVANAVEALGEVHLPTCVDLILPKLGSRNNRVKANAALALFGFGHIEVIDTLKPMLMYSDPLMRSSAAFAIGELSQIVEKHSLVDRWKAKPQEAKVFLAEIQECVPMLVALLRDPEPTVKRQAVIALGKIKDKSAVLPIIDQVNLDKDSKEFIQDVSEALRSIGSHRLVREVIGQLS